MIKEHQLNFCLVSEEWRLHRLSGEERRRGGPCQALKPYISPFRDGSRLGNQLCQI